MTYQLETLVDLAWDQFWQVTVVAIVVATLVAIFGRKRPHLAYLLWMLVIAKCLTPPLWSSPTGLFSWLQAETHQTIRVVAEPGTNVRVVADNPLASPSLDETGAIDAESLQLRIDTASVSQVPAEDGSLDSSVSRDSNPMTVRSPRRTMSLPIGIAIAWGCGAAVCLAIVLIRQLLCTLMVWRFGRVADAKLQSLLESLSRRLGVRRKVRLLVSSEPFGPAVFGLFRPTILLPDMLTRDQFAKRLEPILAHELIHFRRGDTIVGTLQLAALIIWWFHPLVWWASRELTRERERCCDEEAVAGLKCDPSDYAQTLLDVLRSKRQLKPLFAQPGVRSIDITTRRLEHIMRADHVHNPRTPKFCWLVAGLIAALVLPGGGLVLELGAAGDADVDEITEAPGSDRDWPQYGGGPQRNNVSREQDLPTTWNVETGENIEWTAKLGDAVYSSPVMANGKVLIGTNNSAVYSTRFPKGTDASCLLCFDAITGKFLWQHANEKLASGRVNDWPGIGICSTSMIEGDRVWYVNNRDEVVCLDLEGFYDNDNDGPFRDEPATALGEADVVWKLDMIAKFGVAPHNQSICSITAVDDLLLVGTSHGIDLAHVNQPADAPSFIAVHKTTGRVVWQDESPSGNLLHGQWSSPAYGVIGGVGQAIFAGGDGWLYSFDVNAIKQGKSELLWKFDCNPKISKWILGGRGTRNNAIAIPVIYGDRVFMVVGQDPEHGEGEGHAWCIDATKRGDISEEVVVREDDRSTPVPHKRLQAADPKGGDVVNPNPNSGVIWHYHQFDRDGDGKIAFEETMHRSLSSVVIHDGLAIISDFSGLVHCLDAATGKPQWTYDMLSTVWSTPLVGDGKIYIGDEDGDVVILELSREMKVLAEINVGNSVYTTIMAAGGTLYVPSQGRLVAVGGATKVPVSATNFRFESVGGAALRVQSREQGGSQEILIQGRCCLTFGEGEHAIVAEADTTVVRGPLEGPIDWSKAEFTLQGNVIWKTADSKIRADSLRYFASSQQCEASSRHGVQLLERDHHPDSP